MTGPEETSNIGRVNGAKRERPGPGFVELLSFRHNSLDHKCLEIGRPWVSELTH